jgi:predicted Zn-dependent protease
MKYCAIFVAFGICASMLCGCETIYNPATGRNETIFIGTAQEVAIGKSMAGQVGTQFRISRDPQRIQKVQGIGRAIAVVSDRTDLEYHFSVIDDKEINAFAVPGGYIYVYSGLMDIATDDELACVVAHEVGHIAARHSVKQMQAQLGYEILMSLIFRDKGSADLAKAVNVAFGVVSLGYSREDELLADKLGVKYAYRAHYNPRAMITFLEKLRKEENKTLAMNFEVLRSHPNIDHRIANVEAALREYAPGARSVTAQTGSAVIYPARTENLAARSENLKFCPKCGRTYKGNYLFCTYDGTKLKEKQ